MEPAWNVRENLLSGTLSGIPAEEIRMALQSLESAPLEEMFTTYASAVRSRGELGVLSSLNQRLWGEYLLLKQFLENALANK